MATVRAADGIMFFKSQSLHSCSQVPFSYLIIHSDVAIKPGCLPKSIALAQPQEECESEQFPVWILMSGPV